MEPEYKFRSLQIEGKLDVILNPLGFAKAHRSALPHAEYSKRCGSLIQYVSLTIETKGQDVTTLGEDFWNDPGVSLHMGLNSATHRVVIEFPLGLNVRHSDAMLAVEHVPATAHWLRHLGETPGFLDFVRKHPTKVDSIADYCSLIASDASS